MSDATTTPNESAQPGPSDLAMLDTLRNGREAILAELSKVVVGQKDVVDQILMALFCRGHGLIVGVPGLAKTLMVRTLARVLDLSFSRVQFTPDLMPSDIIGTDVIEEGQSRRVAAELQSHSLSGVVRSTKTEAAERQLVRRSVVCETGSSRATEGQRDRGAER